MAEPIDKDTRGPVNLRIKFRSESLQQFIERYGVDVSRGGIFIRTREPLPVGTRLKLDFQLVDTAPLFQGDGTVVWIREHDASRAGVTPGMGVRFDRLTPESQTTLDTILEEKIRLQQSGVAPGSIAKAGAGMAVRRPSGAFATIESSAPKPAAPPPLPVAAKPHAPPPMPGSAGHGAAAPVGAAPISPMPASSTRSGPLAASTTSSSNSIFNRPRTTSGLRTVPVPSALFEPPTADDIDKALSALEEKGGPAPSLPAAPVVIPRTDSKSLADDEPTKVFDGSVEKEFAAHDAITGRASLVPENGIPIDTEGAEGDETQRRSVDPNSGKVTLEGGHDGKAPPPPAILDAPLASLVDSGAAPPAKPPAPPPSKPSATGALTSSSSSIPVPIKIATDRPGATESGRFRSDTRYKRKRGKALPIALGVLLVGGGVAAGGYYLKVQRDKRAADAIAAAAAAPPIAAGQEVPGPTPPAPAGQQAAPGPETAPAPAPAPAVANPPTAEAPAKTTAPAPKPEEAAAKIEGKSDAKAEKPKAEKDGEKPRRRRDRAASAAAEVAAKPSEAAAEKKPGEEPRPAAEKPAEAAAEKKPAEAAPAAAAVLKITSTPAGAEVVIDGVPVGTTPVSLKDIDPAGTHAISVKKDGYDSHERMISGSDWSRGKGGQMLKFNVKLKKVGGETKPADTGEKKPPDVEILTPSEP